MAHNFLRVFLPSIGDFISGCFRPLDVSGLAILDWFSACNLKYVKIPVSIYFQRNVFRIYLVILFLILISYQTKAIGEVW